MEARLTEISLSEALRYLGVRGEPDETLRGDLARCAEALRRAARPRAVWRMFTPGPDGALEGTAFRPAGRDIRAHLEGCGQVILLAATLGAEAETLLRRAGARSMADAVLMDALGSAAIENVCDNLCADLAARFAPRVLTSRFSPGYGDFPLSQQRELCEVLNVTRMAGITLTPGGMMIPQKSVTALLGVREAEAKGEEAAGRSGESERDAPGTFRKGAASGCASCAAFEHCIYRKESTSCGR